MKGLPSVVFGVVALAPAFMALFLPDTSKAVLPDDINAAENLDKLTVGDDVEESPYSKNISVQEKQRYNQELWTGHNNIMFKWIMENKQISNDLTECSIIVTFAFQ